jgi:hypothetical protein
VGSCALAVPRRQGGLSFPVAFALEFALALLLLLALEGFIRLRRLRSRLVILPCDDFVEVRATTDGRRLSRGFRLLLGAFAHGLFLRSSLRLQVPELLAQILGLKR